MHPTLVQQHLVLMRNLNKYGLVSKKQKDSFIQLSSSILSKNSISYSMHGTIALPGEITSTDIKKCRSPNSRPIPSIDGNLKKENHDYHKCCDPIVSKLSRMPISRGVVRRDTVRSGQQAPAITPLIRTYVDLLSISSNTNNTINKYYILSEETLYHPLCSSESMFNLAFQGRRITMGSPTPTDEAPSYQELYEQRPANAASGVIYLSPRPNNMKGFCRSFFSSVAQYSRVAVDDSPDIEGNAHVHGDHPNPIALADRSGSDHAHCETCDKITERTKARQARTLICRIVSRTFVILGLWLTIFGVFAVIFLGRRR